MKVAIETTFRSLTSENTKHSSSIASTICASAGENEAPKQIRGPPPKGRLAFKAIVATEASADSRKLEQNRTPRVVHRVLSGFAMSAFTLYVVGFIVLLAGLAYGAFLLHVPHAWIGVGALVMIGLGVMSAVSHTKHRDAPNTPPDA